MNRLTALRPAHRAAATIRLALAIAAFFIALTHLSAQDNKPTSPPAQATTSFDGITVTVDYAQPSKRGREIFGGLVPYNAVWRTGANSATKITFSHDATIGGKPIKAGTYGLFTIPGKERWTIILNTDAKQWGAYSYDAKKDILRVDVPAGKSSSIVETFTIAFEKADKGATMTLAWDTVKVSVPLAK